MQRLTPISLSVLACVLVALTILYVADSAPAGSAGGRWQYTILNFGDVIIDVQLTDEDIREAERRGIDKARNLEEKFNRLGADGWELAACTTGSAVFKRPAR